MCEEFPGRLPTEIANEEDRLPPGFLPQLIEARYYARVKAATDAATTPEARKALPTGGMWDLVVDIEHEIVEADNAEEQAKAQRT